MTQRALQTAVLATVTTVGCGFAALFASIGMPPAGTPCSGSQYDHPVPFAILIVAGMVLAIAGLTTVARTIRLSGTTLSYAIGNGVMMLGIFLFFLSFTFMPVQVFCLLLNSAL